MTGRIHDDLTTIVRWLFPCLRGLLENVGPFIPCLCFFFFFFEVEINLRTLIPLFRPRSVHSGSASVVLVLTDGMHDYLRLSPAFK